jgi:hypothetical protein
MSPLGRAAQNPGSNRTKQTPEPLILSFLAIGRTFQGPRPTELRKKRGAFGEGFVSIKVFMLELKLIYYKGIEEVIDPFLGIWSGA